MEIACDESGFSGTNLLDPATPVITHASVDLTRPEAEALLAGLRDGQRFSLGELKSGRFLRDLAAGAPLAAFEAALEGRSHVHVVDKREFLAGRIVDLFLHEPSYAAGTRLGAARDEARVVDRVLQEHPRGPELLAAFVELVRTKRRRHPDRSAFDRFFDARDALLPDLADGGESLAGLERDHVWAVVSRLAEDDRAVPPPLEPLLPALAETVLHWSAGRREVLVTHDEQSALTADRLRRLQQALGERAGLADGVSPLAGLLAVDSRDDPRVQVADLLAGLSRRTAERSCRRTPLASEPTRSEENDERSRPATSL